VSIGKRLERVGKRVQQIGPPFPHPVEISPPSCTYCSDYGCEMCPDSYQTKLRARVAVLEGLLQASLAFIEGDGPLELELSLILKIRAALAPSPLMEGK
jgi:hypothetical protein